MEIFCTGVHKGEKIQVENTREISIQVIMPLSDSLLIANYSFFLSLFLYSILHIPNIPNAVKHIQ